MPRVPAADNSNSSRSSSSDPKLCISIRHTRDASCKTTPAASKSRKAGLLQHVLGGGHELLRSHGRKWLRIEYRRCGGPRTTADVKELTSSDNDVLILYLAHGGTPDPAY
jgi:hypothetical protein